MAISEDKKLILIKFGFPARKWERGSRGWRSHEPTDEEWKERWDTYSNMVHNIMSRRKAATNES